jgi:UDP-glucuronate decarboxylase
VRAINTNDDFTGPVNIGNAGELSMLELANSVLRLTGPQSEISFKRLPLDELKQRQPDISLAKTVLS